MRTPFCGHRASSPLTAQRPGDEPQAARAVTLSYDEIRAPIDGSIAVLGCLAERRYSPPPARDLRFEKPDEFIVLEFLIGRSRLASPQFGASDQIAFFGALMDICTAI